MSESTATNGNTHAANGFGLGRQLVSYKKERVYLDFITHKGGNTFELEGYISADPLPESTKIFVEVNDQSYDAERVERKQRAVHNNDSKYDGSGAFRVSLNLIPNIKNTLRVVVELDGSRHQLRIKAGEFSGLAPLMWAYRQKGNWLFVKRTKALDIRPYARTRHMLYEIRFLARILFYWQIRHALSRLVILRSEGKIRLSEPIGVAKQVVVSAAIIAETIVLIPRAFLLRSAYYMARRRKRRPIWMVSDRAVAAGDNGEALFKYILRQADCPADVYFVISKKTEAFAELSKIGKVLDPASLKYKLMFLLADKVISSQADIPVYNPFVRQVSHFVDLYAYDFVFLQHGVIRHDLSTWLNRYNRNIRLFITTAKKEYDSILSNPYYYPVENVLLSGQPRYDLLENRPNRKLILSPTYRGNLLRSGADKKGQRRYDPTFKESEYRNFYNNLMNDPRLTKELERHDMTGEFYLHPVFAAQRPDFDENDRFKIVQFPYDYKKAFSEGELLISDHSSVVFDFVYLKKPTVYAHFDIDTFFNGHSYSKSDFFSDEEDGFGAVYYEYDTLVEGVVHILADNCKMPAKYQKRVDDFFYKVDKNNSQRVYQAILALDN
jgi:CDP-glycerol glycerophosphotransferase (TagB/SpsB family)